FFVLAVCVFSFTLFIERGYSQIAEMQSMKAQWQRKAPLADISICDGNPCVKVYTEKSYGDNKDTYMIIK
ncbi:tRNA modification GTPase, partial [Providencia stuartii]